MDLATKLLLLGLSFCIFTSWVLFVWKKYGIQVSISASFYRLPRNLKFIFTLVLWGFAIPIAIVADTGTLFFSAATIMFTGAAPHYNNSELELKTHITSAMLGVIMGYIHLIFVTHQYWLVLASLLAGISLIEWRTFFFKKIMLVKNYTWWAEIIAYLTIIIGVLLTQLR